MKLAARSSCSSGSSGSSKSFHNIASPFFFNFVPRQIGEFPQFSVTSALARNARLLVLFQSGVSRQNRAPNDLLVADRGFQFLWRGTEGESGGRAVGVQQLRLSAGRADASGPVRSQRDRPSIEARRPVDRLSTRGTAMPVPGRSQPGPGAGDSYSLDRVTSSGRPVAIPRAGLRLVLA